VQTAEILSPQIENKKENSIKIPVLDVLPINDDYLNRVSLEICTFCILNYLFGTVIKQLSNEITYFYEQRNMKK
jgi:hypothetical protein